MRSGESWKSHPQYLASPSGPRSWVLPIPLRPAVSTLAQWGLFIPSMSIILNGVSATVSENTDGHIITCNQVITDEFIDGLKAERDASMSVREKDYQRVASIPVVLIDKWMKDGFDFWNESVSKIVAKLKNEGLEYFVTTGKAV